MGSQDGAGTADLVEQGEDLDLRFQFFRDGLDDQVGLAGRVFDTAGKFQTGKSGIGGVGGNPA